MDNTHQKVRYLFSILGLVLVGNVYGQMTLPTDPEGPCAQLWNHNKIQRIELTKRKVRFKLLVSRQELSGNKSLREVPCFSFSDLDGRGNGIHTSETTIGTKIAFGRSLLKQKYEQKTYI